MSACRRTRRVVAPAALALAMALAPGCAGDRDDAPTDARAAEARPETEFWVAFRAASRARRYGDDEAAIAQYERALGLDPAHGDSLYYLGHIRYRRGEVAVAAGLFERLLEIEPRGLRGWQQVSIVRGQPAPGWSIDLEGAVAAAQRALRLNRGESRSHLLLARWRAYQGRSAEAEAHLDDALGHNPGLWEAVQLRLWLALRSGDRRSAAMMARQSVDRLCAGVPGAAPGCAPHAPLHEILFAILPELLGEPEEDGRGGQDFAVEAADLADWERIAGPVGSMLRVEPPQATGDLDGDGDVDVVMLEPAEPSLQRPEGGEGSEGDDAEGGEGDEARVAEGAVVSWWHSDGERLTRAGGVLLPTDRVLALALGDFDGDGSADVYVATGGPGPEFVASDRLLVGHGAGFVDATHRLGGEVFGVTRELAIGADGSLLLLRGGLVPADPVRVFALRRR